MKIDTGSFKSIQGRSYFIANSPLSWEGEKDVRIPAETIVLQVRIAKKIKFIDYEKVTDREEAIASCAIEGISSEDDLTYNYEGVLEYIDENKPDLTLDNILKLHAQLMNYSKNSGALRNHNVKVGEFYPAPWTELIKLMDDFIKFINDENLDPLLTTAIAHAYFESIHPFHDGNGRMGRILILWMLIKKDVLENTALTPSVFFLNNKKDYYKLLNAYSSEGDVNNWIKFFLNSLLWEN